MLSERKIIEESKKWRIGGRRWKGVVKRKEARKKEQDQNDTTEEDAIMQKRAPL